MNKIYYVPDAMGASGKIGGITYQAPDKETLLEWVKELFPHLEFELVRHPNSK